MRRNANNPVNVHRDLHRPFASPAHRTSQQTNLARNVCPSLNLRELEDPAEPFGFRVRLFLWTLEPLVINKSSSERSKHVQLLWVTFFVCQRLLATRFKAQIHINFQGSILILLMSKRVPGQSESMNVHQFQTSCAYLCTIAVINISMQRIKF